MGPARVGAVMVHHDLPDEILQRSLQALTAAGALERVLLVCNGSVPGDHVIPPGVEVLRTVNRGYGAAANLGVHRLRDDGVEFVALLNDDVIVEPGWIDPLLSVLAEDGTVAAVQPTLRFADTDPPIVNSTGVVVGPDGAGVDRHVGEVDREGLGGGEVAIVSAGAVVIRADAFADLCGFDDRFVLYYEDVDFCLRGGERGWRFVHVPESKVWHLHGGSAGSDRRPGGRSARSVFLQERNRLWCAVRFAPPSTVARAWWLSIRRLRHEPRAVHRRALTTALGSVGRLVRERRVARSLSSPRCR